MDGDGRGVAKQEAEGNFRHRRAPAVGAGVPRRRSQAASRQGRGENKQV